MVRLLLVRHGETAWNAELRYQGQLDIPLNEAGVGQAAAVARRLAHVHLDAAYASDLQRAWQTAETIVSGHGLQAQPEPRIRELNFGAWEGLTSAEVRAQYPAVQRVWERNPEEAILPGGDSVRQAFSRIGAAIDEIVARHPGQILLIVGHGGSLQLMLCYLLGIGINRRRVFRFDNASLSQVQVSEWGVNIVQLNDVCHLSSCVLGA